MSATATAGPPASTPPSRPRPAAGPNCRPRVQREFCHQSLAERLVAPGHRHILVLVMADAADASADGGRVEFPESIHPVSFFLHRKSRSWSRPAGGSPAPPLPFEQIPSRQLHAQGWQAGSVSWVVLPVLDFDFLVGGSIRLTPFEEDDLGDTQVGRVVSADWPPAEDAERLKPILEELRELARDKLAAERSRERAAG
jgi:hypothetical protein